MENTELRSFGTIWNQVLYFDHCVFKINQLSGYHLSDLRGEIFFFFAEGLESLCFYIFHGYNVNKSRSCNRYNKIHLIHSLHHYINQKSKDF